MAPSTINGTNTDAERITPGRCKHHASVDSGPGRVGGLDACSACSRMPSLRPRRRLRRRSPALIASAYIVLALVLGGWGGAVGARIFGRELSPMSSESALEVLSSIAAGMMALTAIVFSLVFVAIQLGHSAYSPRLLHALGERQFLAHALGIFTGTFLFALLAIRTVDVVGGPGINVSVVAIALLWLLASIGVLVLVLPRIRALSLGDVLAGLQRRADAATLKVYPHALAAPATARPAPAVTELPELTAELRHAGPPQYVVGLDLARLVRCAADAGAVLEVPLAIGDAVIAGDRLAVVRGGAQPIDEARVRGAIWLAGERSLYEDPAYALRLFVDIAIRALSPAVNDPTTAVNVLDAIDGLLRLLGRRRLELAHATDEAGAIRVVRAVPSWEDLVALALTEIHHYGRDSFQVERRLAGLLRDLPAALPLERRPALERFARWRDASLADRLRDARGWLDPSAVDRQGLGHVEPSPGFA